jgi:hypothetical protein
MASSRKCRIRLGLLAGLASAVAPVVLALDPQPPVVVARNVLGDAAIGPCGNPHFARGNSRYVSFYCFGSLTPEDDNDRPDTFWFDRENGMLERVSVTSQEEEIRFESYDGFPSNNGRYVALESWGPLHPDAAPNSPGFERLNAFLRDRLTGTTDFISRNAAGQLSLNEVGLQDALPERSEVLLQTWSWLLTPPDDVLAHDTNLYIRNWATGAIELITAATNGGLSTGDAGLGRLSTSGRFVVFGSSATDLPGAPVFGSGINLYLRDRHFATTERLTYPWHGGEFTGEMNLQARSPRITPDGRYVTFASGHPEVLPVDPNIDPFTLQVYLLDRQSGLTERISVDENGVPGNGFNGNIDMSDDGRYVAFFSRSTNLPAGESAIYVIDRQTGEWVNVTESLGPTSSSSPSLELARDGSAIAFSWRVADPALPDLLGRNPIYVVDLGLAGPAPAPEPVPGSARGWLLVLAGLMMFIALSVLRLRRLPQAKSMAKSWPARQQCLPFDPAVRHGQ